jgi:golgi SNAP receptor complex member 1
VAYSKIGAGSANNQNNDTAPLLGENVFDSLSVEIEQMMDRLSNINERMGELHTPGSGAAMVHTLQRHREILQGYKQEFTKIQANHATRIEREELLRGSGLSSPSTGLSRRDMFLKESTHIQNSHSLVNDQITIALETKEHLVSQRHNLKRLQTRLNDISNRFPVISR